MRTRIASFAAALVLATAAFAGTAGSALMATPVQIMFCQSNDGLVSAYYVYDASLNPPPITDIETINTGTVAETLGVSVYSTTGTLLWSGARSAVPGTTDSNITSLGAHMVAVQGKPGTTGTFWALPVIVQCAS